MTKTIELNKKLNFTPHPNVIFATKVDSDKTEGGVFIPESADSPTPVVKIRAVGENVEKQFSETDFDLSVGDKVYVESTYMRFAEVDGVAGIILMADGIIGKVND